MRVLRSFKYAGKGLIHGLEEHNMKFHIVAAVVVVGMALFFSITVSEWIAVALAIGLVIVVELVNTAIEEICDMITEAYPKSYDKAGKPKDIGAGAVLVASIVAVSVGLLVFTPYFVSTFT